MRERLSIIGIVAFVVIDVILVALAVRHTRATPPSLDESQLTLPSPSDSADKSTPQNASPKESEKPSFDQPLYMSVSEDAAYIKATRGSCGAGVKPVLSVSTDGGRSFSEGAIPDLTEVLRVQANAADDLWVVGLNRRCKVQMFGTENGGESWSPRPNAGIAWYLVDDPKRSRLHTPGGTVDTPCAPISLSTIDAGVLRLLCEDGRILGTEDTGKSWVTLGGLEGAVAIRFTTPGDGYAVAVRDDCPAAVLQTADGGADWQMIKCLGDGQPRSVAAEGDLVAAQVGGDLHVSEDGGQSWQIL